MSIRDEINNRIGEGRLFVLTPRIAGDPQERTIFMSAEINNLISEPWPDNAEGLRRAKLRADLEYFVSGRLLSVCWQPGKGREVHQLGRLDAPDDEVWDYRSVDPSPGLRVFCRFAEKDTLVAFTCSPRSVHVSWLNRIPLLERTSQEWKTAVKECRAEWSKLLPTYPPHSGVSLHEYLSNAVLQ